MTETRIADLDWLPSDMNYSWEGQEKCHAWAERKKNPKKGINTHCDVFTLCPIFHNLGFLKILHRTGEDLVNQVGTCAGFIIAQTHVSLALSATISVQVKLEVLFTSRDIPTQLGGSSWTSLSYSSRPCGHLNSNWEQIFNNCVPDVDTKWRAPVAKFAKSFWLKGSLDLSGHPSSRN